MKQYVLCNRYGLDTIIKKLIDDSETETADHVKKMISSRMFGWELEEIDFKIPEELYDEKIILPDYDYKTDNKMCLELAKILLENKTKIAEDQEYLKKVLNSETIEELLINKNNSTLNKKVFYALCDLRADMKDVDLSGVYIHGYDFRGLKNVTIDLDKVKEKDLINVNFAGVTLIGSLDNSKLYYTRFAGCETECKLNPQTIAHKSMMCTDLCDITVEGSFDGVKIDNCNFVGAEGVIKINPQTVYNKTLDGLNLEGCYILGENDSEPSFKGCIVKNCDFNGVKNKITFNLDDLEYYTVFGRDENWNKKEIKSKLYDCNLIGHTLTGNVLVSELKTIVYGCSTYIMPTWPNKSATTDVLNSPYEGPLWSINSINLLDYEDYNRKDVNININIIGIEKERQETYSEQETRTKNIKKLKKLELKKRFTDFLKQVF